MNGPEYLTLNYPAYRAQRKLSAGQIADRTSWARVPDTDLIKAASHIIRILPGNGYTLTEVNEMDPGISEESVGEGRGWFDPPRSYGHCAVHGRCLR